MGRAVVPILRFNGGEVGADTMARIDLENGHYSSLAETMENCWAGVQGTLSKAPGTEYFGATPGNSVAILRPFVFDEDDAVCLELSNLKLRFVHKSDGFVSVLGAAATIGNFTDQSAPGASVTTGSTSTTLTATDAATAKARSTITTGAPATPATLKFSTDRRVVKVRIGSSAGGEEILPDTEFAPGEHVITFTPGVATYYFQVSLDVAGSATLTSLTRVAAGILELATPWAAADLPLLRHEQQRDAMWWYLESKPTRVLERRGAASWSLRKFQPEDGPLDDANISDETLTPSALEGTATITASKAMFSAADVGRLVGIKHQGQNVTHSFTGTSQNTQAIRVTGVDADRVFYISITGTWVGAIELQRSVGNDLDFAAYGGPYVANTATSIDDGLDNQIIYYRFATTAWTSGTATVTITYARGATKGFARIYQFNSATSVGVDVLVDFGKTTATTEWALGAWSDGQGWPVAGTLHGGRHWLVRADRIWGSVSGDYESMAVGSDDGAAIDEVFGTGDVNDARWIEGASRLLVGTSGAAIEVRASSFDEPLVPGAMNAVSVANKGKGAAPVQAERIDKRILYAGKNRKRLYQLYYNLDENSYAPDDLTRLHRTILGEDFDDANDGVVELSVQYEPEPRLWAVRADGQCAALTVAPEEGVYSWARLKEDGGDGFESVCALPGSPEDHVFFVVRRTVNGATVRTVEKLARQRWSDISSAWRLRCALAVAAPAGNTISGLAHLEGRQVWAWADGRPQGPFTVTAGAITLAADSYAYVIVGLNFTATWKSSKLCYGAQMGTALCQQKQFTRVGFVTKDCVADSFRYGDASIAQYNSWPSPDDSSIDEATLDQPLAPLSRDDMNIAQSAAATDPRLTLLMDTPAPVEILALVIDIATRER